ncbi:MAG TPA: hypothetical protein VGQ09_13135 [Chitinophagaceae bacterium]|jgi:hypothetical protein|nr:hypothetical protein [Chitinophagaceae bacterium]
MDLRETILAEHSKANCNKIVKWVGHSQERFDELFNLFLNSEYRINQRAAWPLSYCVIDHPHFIAKHFSKLIKNLHKPGIHDSVKRNTVRLLQHVDIPEKFHGEVMDICFSYISSTDEPVAIKAFSLTILQNLSKHYPEIKNEIKLIIEERWEYETVAFKTRAKKFLKSL